MYSHQVVSFNTREQTNTLDKHKEIVLSVSVIVAQNIFVYYILGFLL